MLTTQEAQQRLEHLKTADWIRQTKSRLDKLHGNAATAGAHLTKWLTAPQFNDTPLLTHQIAADYSLELAPVTSDFYLPDFMNIYFNLGAELDETLDDPKARRELFNALLPRLAPYLDRAWTMMQSLPSIYCKNAPPFRSPRNPDQTRQLRRHWLCLLITLAVKYDHPVTWFAEWAVWLNMDQHLDLCLGVLFAAAIDEGGREGEAVYRILRESAEGSHPIGGMGHHILHAFLICSRSEAWGIVGDLLINAGREDGLRVAIMRTLAYSNIHALQRMMHVISEHGLMRINVIQEMISHWLGLVPSSKGNGNIDEWLDWMVNLINDPQARRNALKSDIKIVVYWTLWAEAVVDTDSAIAQATPMLNDPDPARRMAAVFLLAQTRLDSAASAMIPALNDDDLRIASMACRTIFKHDSIDPQIRSTIFDRLKQLTARLPEEEDTPWPSVPGEPNWILWQGGQKVLGRASVLMPMCRYAREEHIPELRELISEMDNQGRGALIQMLQPHISTSVEARSLLVMLCGDASSLVRRYAFQVMDEVPPENLDILALENLLLRKAADVRRGVLDLLIKLDDSSVLASASRLLAGKAAQRQAGLELLARLAETDRLIDQARDMAEKTRESVTNVSQDDLALFKRLLGSPGKEPPQEPPTYLNAFGFYDPKECTPPEPPTMCEPFLDFTTARRCLADLIAFIEQHQGTPYSFRGHYSENHEELNLNSRFPDLNWGSDFFEHYDPEPPLKDLWEQWYQERSVDLRDPDGLELVRAHLLLHWEEYRDGYQTTRHYEWVQIQSDTLFGVEDAPTHLTTLLRGILSWLLRFHQSEATPDYLLDLYETALALVPRDVIDSTRQPPMHKPALYPRHHHWPSTDPIKMIEKDIKFHRILASDFWLPRHRARLWRLEQWICFPVSEKPTGADWRSRHYHFEWSHDETEPPEPSYNCIMPLLLSIEAFQEGSINEADIVSVLMDSYGRTSIDSLYSKYSSSIKDLEAYPAFNDLWLRLQTHLLEFELAQSEQSTPAASYVKSMNRIDGHQWMLRFLVASGPKGLVRTNYPHPENKAELISHLIQICRPTPEDTPQQMTETIRKMKIPPQRMIDLSVYAPIWAHIIEEAIDMNGMAEAIFWIYAHARGSLNWKDDPEKKWINTMIAKFTTLSSEDFDEGAVDGSWFHSIYERLGDDKWIKLDKAAKYCANGGGQKRAQLYASTMLGHADRPALIAKITEKRDKDAARAIGLLPLAKGAQREPDLIERYEILQEMQHTSRQFGAQRRASENRAVQMGIDNLAGTAGYRDAQQLRWAMEARTVADLADGPISASSGDVLVTLAIDAQGQPVFTVSRAGKPLKSIPSAIKKDTAVKELLTRHGELKKQASRMRQSIELAMIHGDVFSKKELFGLYAHPLLKPLLENLLFINDDDAASPDRLVGYPTDEGRSLVNLSGESIPLSEDLNVRIAHPLDLLESGHWPDWQRECLVYERVQPFKQIFRELYIPTDSELKDEEGSRRYSGWRLAPRKALGLLGGRGWVHEHFFDEEASLRRTYHKADIAARLQFDEAFHSPGEVDYATIAMVEFTDKGGWHYKSIKEVPPRLFSETMRDLDLAVSVASHDGFNIETSVSSIEMRAALVSETAAVLGLNSVHIDGNHGIIAGKLASYSVHLGSGLVQALAGGSIVLLPANPPYAGRIFLPFADDDPKTAEILSKVLLLASDDKIKDPTILKQLRRLDT